MHDESWRVPGDGGSTFNLADERLFCSIEEAGPVIVELMTKRLSQLRVTNETARLAKATRT